MEHAEARAPGVNADLTSVRPEGSAIRTDQHEEKAGPLGRPCPRGWGPPAHPCLLTAAVPGFWKCVGVGLGHSHNGEGSAQHFTGGSANCAPAKEHSSHFPRSHRQPYFLP